MCNCFSRGGQLRGAFVAIFSLLPAAMAFGADLPEVTTIPPAGSAHTSELATVTYRLSWPAGEAQVWRIPAPEIEQPEWGSAYLLASRAYEAGGRTVVEFEVGVVADEVGEYELPPIEFQAHRAEDIVKNESAPLREAPAPWGPPSESDVLQVVSSKVVLIRVVTDYAPIAGFSAAAVACLLVLLAGAWGVRRTLSGGPVLAPLPVASDPREYVHAARKHRLDGDFYSFYQALVAAAGGAAGPEAIRLRARFKERAREVGYGGARPTDDELDAALKDVERHLTASGG